MANRMKWEKLLSTRRVSQFDSCAVQSKASQYIDPRHSFERDCDQIIFCYPFRRLQDKTQVIPFPEYDFVHTRLTHSLEVSSVGRSLGKLAASLIFPELDEEFLQSQKLCSSDIGALVAGACLAHDIGNPPFGHSGESSISYYFKNNKAIFFSSDDLMNISNEDATHFHFERPIYKNKSYFSSIKKEDLIASIKYNKDLSNFEGNANGFRILTQNCDRGINPTSALLGTFMKYPRESFILSVPYTKTNQPKSFSKYGIFQTEKKVWEQVAEELGLIAVEGIDHYDIAYHRHPLCFLMEASDDISYGIIDFEDGCRLGLIDFEKHYNTLKIRNKQGVIEEIEINSSPVNILIDIASIDISFERSRVDNAPDYKQAISYLRAKVINVLINECFQIFKENYESIMNGSYPKALIEDITNTTILISLKKMKALVRRFVYNYPTVLQSEASGFEVMSKLIESFAISSEICISCNEGETEKAQKLSALLPDEYRPSIETNLQSLTEKEIYERLMRVMDYVSGMTDNYATSIYKKISGIA
jgi:dGTPase